MKTVGEIPTVYTFQGDTMLTHDVDKMIEQINDSWMLALSSAGVSREIIDGCKLTVVDFITNHLGDD